jgi:putative transposase
MEHYQVSQRRACELLGVPRSSLRYESRRDDRVLREKLIGLARERPRFGYRRLHVLLQREGQSINHKRVWRVYKAAGLSVKRTRRKKLIRSLRPALLLHAANQEWAIDFVSDVMHAGRSFRVLSVVDSFTRECLALEVDTSMGSQRVTRVLDRIIQQRGLPLAVRSDNGPELTSRHFLAWSIENKVDLIHIQPGKPVQNAHVESFNGRLRDECLNVSWFWNLFDARHKIEVWRKDYNGRRPHSSLGYRTPEEFACQAAPSPPRSSSSAPPNSPQGQALRAAAPALTRPGYALSHSISKAKRLCIGALNLAKVSGRTLGADHQPPNFELLPGICQIKKKLSVQTLIA